METKLTQEQLEHIDEIIGERCYVYGIDTKRQSLLFDGELFISNILEAADYIRSVTQKQ